MPAARGVMTKQMIIRRHPAVLQGKFPAVTGPDRINPAAHILVLKNALLVSDDRRKDKPGWRSLVGAKITEPRFDRTQRPDLEPF